MGAPVPQKQRLESRAHCPHHTRGDARHGSPQPRPREVPQPMPWCLLCSKDHLDIHILGSGLQTYDQRGFQAPGGHTATVYPKLQLHFLTQTLKMENEKFHLVDERTEVDSLSFCGSVVLCLKSPQMSTPRKHLPRSIVSLDGIG